MKIFSQTSVSSENPIDGSYAWLRLAISIGIGTIGSIGFWGVIVALPAVQGEFGVDRGDASIPYTLTMIGFSAGNALIGRYVDRFGIVIPIIASAISMGFGFAGAAVATNIWIFSLLHGVLVGVGTAATFGPLIADISHWFLRRRGLAVALCACGIFFGGAIWPLIMQLLMEGYGWRASYLAVSVVIVVTMVPLGLALQQTPPKKDPAQTRPLMQEY